MPESLAVLASRQAQDSLAQRNTARRKLGRAQLSQLPSPPPNTGKRAGSVMALLTPEYRHRTLLISFTYVMVMMTLYFVLNWTPNVVVDAGLNDAVGIQARVLVNIGGVIGAAILGILAVRFRGGRTQRLSLGVWF